jgi:hypothetical protein
MKRTIVVPLTLLFLASCALASPLCTNVGLDVYVATYGTNNISNSCQVGDKLFYDFGFSATYNNGTPPVPSDVTVIPDPGDGITNPGLVFSSGAFLAFPTDVMDITLTYRIATVSGTAAIDDYTLSMAGSHTKQPTGLGFGSVTESFSNSPVGTPLLTTVGPDGTNINSAHVDFTPFVSGVFVNTLIHVESPATGNDWVTISAIQEHFSEEIPEPYEVVLIGSGLCLLGLRRRRATRLM